MLIPIIKESERILEEQFWLGDEYPDESLGGNYKEVKSNLRSSQLALLEGQVKMYEGMKEPFPHGYPKAGEFCLADGYNFALSEVIQSLEESITYLKSKI